METTTTTATPAPTVTVKDGRVIANGRMVGTVARFPGGTWEARTRSGRRAGCSYSTRREAAAALARRFTA